MYASSFMIDFALLLLALFALLLICGVSHSKSTQF